MDKERKRIKVNGVRCFGCEFCRHEVDHAALGHDLRAEREKAGMAQSEVGKLMKVSYGFVSDLENGRRNWTPQMIDRYLAAVRGTP